MMKIHSVKSGLATLNAESIGDGTPIVFLHAAVADTRMWSEQMEQVGLKNRAIAYDRRGFGKTSAAPEDYSSVADLLALLDSLGEQEPAILVGCSQGGRVALDVALEHPSKIAGLVLVAPNVSGAPDPKLSPAISHLLSQQAAAIQEGDIDQINKIKARLWLDGPLEAEGRVSGQTRDLLIDMNSRVLQAPSVGNDLDISHIAPSFNRLSELKMPSLMIWGDLDFPHIKDRCQAAAQRIANCSSVELSGSAHLPSLDNSNAFTAALIEFIENLTPQGSQSAL